MPGSTACVMPGVLASGAMIRPATIAATRSRAASLGIDQRVETEPPQRQAHRRDVAVRLRARDCERAELLGP